MRLSNFLVINAMPIFSYTAKSIDETITKGTLDSPNEKLLRDTLLNQGLYLVEAKNLSFFSRLDIKKILFNEKVTVDDLLIFTRQMYNLSKSGIPIIRSISTIEVTSHNPVLKAALNDIVLSLESGQLLSQSMSKYNYIFSDLMISILEVGEETGNIDKSFLQISKYLKREKTTSSQIKSALRYPTMVLFTIIIAMIIVNIFVIPSFVDFFDKFKVDLPIYTKILISVSNFTVNFWSEGLAVILIIFIIIKKYLKTTDGLFFYDKYILKMPVVGSIIHKSLMERFSRSLYLALDSGVPIINSLNLIAKAIDNKYIEHEIIKIKNGVQEGVLISKLMSKNDVFDVIVVQIISISEETGDFSDMLNNISDYYSDEIDVEISQLSSAIEPIMITIIGMMVLVLALGIFMPMWDLSNITNN